MRTSKILILLFIFSLVFAACTEVNNKNDYLPNSAKIRFMLTDCPINYQEVNIDVLSVEAIIDDSLIVLQTFDGIYNILEFVNGRDTIFVNDDIPSGMLSQVRLVLGENNSVMIDSVLYDLEVPSGHESGLKFKVNKEIIAGQTYTYVIDFNAAKSIVKTGHGKYILKPVIHVFTESVTGSIKGYVQPPEAEPAVMAIGPGDDTTTIFSDPVSGKFKIRGLTAGFYDLEFHPDSGFADTTLFDIEVFAGQTTVLDTLWFQ